MPVDSQGNKNKKTHICKTAPSPYKSTILVRLDCYTQTPFTGGLKEQTFVSQGLEAGKPKIKVPTDYPVPGKILLPGLQMAAFLFYPYMMETDTERQRGKQGRGEKKRGREKEMEREMDREREGESTHSGLPYSSYKGTNPPWGLRLHDST